MKDSPESMDRIADLFFEAIHEPVRWKDCLDAVSEFAECRGAVILPIQGPAPNAPASAETEDLIKAYFAEEWCFRDVRDKGLYRFNHQGITVDQDYVTPDFMAKSPYYNDFICKKGFKWFAGLELKVGADRWALALQRTSRQGMFTDDEQELLLRLRPRLNRALTFAQDIESERTQAISDSIDQIRLPAFAFDRTGKVMVMNARAEAIFRERLSLRDGFVGCHDYAQSAELRKYIESVVWQSVRPSRDEFVRPFVIRMPGLRPVVIEARRLAGAASQYFSSARGIATVIDLNSPGVVNESLLMTILGLTRTEARVAALVAAGHTTVEICQTLGVSPETVRTHLKQIREKTSVRRQSELALVVARLATY